ncbi:Pkinase-domain-containing protein [Aulographum hederae CBS 113979]|uniref:non-specific serine/threonine protein kinase n=1 Tax=Aulographum hederae CBS 113979 TaxID=1176131 RepID=A0A6G1GVF1_9PEZI|nr:Pkinase-domain-containing protein [Aulographum hederae CBS 113979]
MSAAAGTSPAIVRTSSQSRSSADRPHRSQSTAHRTSAPRSHSQSHGRSASASQQQGASNVARRDFEDQRQQPPSSFRRSVERAAQQPGRSDSTRSRQRPSSRTRPPSNMPAAPATHTNGMTADAASSRHAPGAPSGSVPRRRTTIDAPATGVWALGKTIGAGSMGKVKLARNMETGEQAAVKIVPRASTEDHRTQHDRERADHSKEVRTEREAAIVSLVNHPYICGMRDVVRTNHHWYMLFEYVNGGQMLDYIISHGRLKEKQARKFGRQIASALDYCHRNSIVHRDLKIENILISKTGDIKIIDFGLSNLFSPYDHLKTFCGSLYFAAPELLQAKQYTGPEVDVWSFGIVLYVLVCGKVPFDDQSMPQLHAKIKKGIVEYPNWLSPECRGLISKMLVTDPKQRASLAEIMNHPWITKGFTTPLENYLPHREPLQLPLDPQVIDGMVGFDFGSFASIDGRLTKVIESEDYQRAVRNSAKMNQMQTPEIERKRSVFDNPFKGNPFGRRQSISGRETLSKPSEDSVQLGSDPVNAYNPLISVYYLVREKHERDRKEKMPGALGIPPAPENKPFAVPELAPPEAAYTNSATYEMSGEKPTGGRSRPRARTHGEDEVVDKVQALNIAPDGHASPQTIVTPPAEPTPTTRKESAAAGLLRRLSTRRHRDHDQPHKPPPSVAIQGPSEGIGAPRKSFSVRRTRDRGAPSSASLHITNSQSQVQQQPELLSPPSASEGITRRLKGLSRSASVNSSDIRRRITRRTTSEASPAAAEAPATSGSDRSGVSDQQTAKPGDATDDNETPQASPNLHSPASRAKSLGHARRESIQARRMRREQSREANVPEEPVNDESIPVGADTENEGPPAASRSRRNSETMKPVYLKGLFSVSTTSNKPLPFIRADIIRVLKQLGVEYHEIKGGFSCKHVPSIDMMRKENINTTGSPAQSHEPPRHATTESLSNRRKISFGGFMGGDRDRDEFREHVREQQQQGTRGSPRTPQTPQHRGGAAMRSNQPGPDLSFTNSEPSDEDTADTARQRAVGETSTHVQSDVGGANMVLKFEIFVVKVPLLSLHGIQFKKVDGNMMRYKNMAQEVLKGLRL